MLTIQRPSRIWSGFGLAGIFVVSYLIGPFITAELNTDPVVLANKVLPAETHYDALSAVVGQFLGLIPFFVGRQVLRTSGDNEQILRVLIIAGLAYSLPMLFEVRMSPQLHFWFYGYYPSDFNQYMRDGGFRPMVFLNHPLATAFFTMTAVVAATAMWRTRTSVTRLPPAVVTAYLSGILLLCKSLAALSYAFILVPLMRYAKPRMQLRVAIVLAIIALSYPLLRMAELVPTTQFLEIASSVNAERESSLKLRFDNEEQLMARASQRLLFGWGRWGRSRVYDEASGQDVSFTDGRWILAIGSFGLFGFFTEFGLLALPIFRAASALRFTKSVRDRINLAALSLILAVNVVDLLPNSGLTSWTWLIAGALLGRTEALRAVTHAQTALYLSPNARKPKPSF